MAISARCSLHSSARGGCDGRRGRVGDGARGRARGVVRGVRRGVHGHPPREADQAVCRASQPAGAARRRPLVVDLRESPRLEGRHLCGDRRSHRLPRARDDDAALVANARPVLQGATAADGLDGLRPATTRHARRMARQHRGAEGQARGAARSDAAGFRSLPPSPWVAECVAHMVRAPTLLCASLLLPHALLTAAY